MQYSFDEIINRRGTLSEKWDTYPEDVLPMWVADSDFRAPTPVIEAITAEVARGIFGYTIEDGAFERAYAGWAAKRYGWAAQAEKTAWCPSLGTALALAIQTFTGPDDSVAMLSPIYPPFVGLCRSNGRMPLESELIAEGTSYRIDFKDLEQKLAHPRTKLFLLCNPHNPTGRVFTKEELTRIGEMCIRHNVVVFSDEIHADVVFSGKHIPFPALGPEFAAISLVGMNASKTFNLADLRAAAVLSENEELLTRFVQTRTRAKLGRCSLGITGVVAAYTQCEDYVDQLLPYLENNMRTAVDFFSRFAPKIHAPMPESTFLLWLDCSGLGMNDKELESFFLNEAKVALNSGAAFSAGGQGHMRLNVACPKATLEEGLARIERALNRVMG